MACGRPGLVLFELTLLLLVRCLGLRRVEYSLPSAGRFSVGLQSHRSNLPRTRQQLFGDFYEKVAEGFSTS